MQRELFIEAADLQLLGEEMLSLEDSRKTLATFYYMVADPPPTFSVIDIESLAVVAPRELRSAVETNRDEFAPTFLVLWEKYSSKLPI